MFIRYNIMKKLKFGEKLTIQQVSNLFPRIPDKMIGDAIDLLGKEGFIVGDPMRGTVEPRTLTSFHDFKRSLRKAFFETAVSISAIIVAVATVIELWQ